MANFHNSTGISTEVILLENIYGNYAPVEDPIYPGYANTVNSQIIGYNFESAKQIIAYFRDDDAHHNLDLVTLLGSAEITPPSYYFYFESHLQQWVPSDHYYSSPDYDWVDNFSVNRISVDNEIDLNNYLSKMENFHSHINENWVNNVSLIGGVPFEYVYRHGEMIHNQMICDNIFNQFNIQKFQAQNGNFTSTAVDDNLENNDHLWNFQVSHGTGHSILFDDGTSLGTFAMRNMTPKERLPIILSVACGNGSFDTEIVNQYMDESYGEAIVASEGAGIAYIGGSRSNGGVPEFEITNGNLNYLGYDDTYSLLFYYIQAYREITNPTLGALFRSAKDKYLLANSMIIDADCAAYVRFVGLNNAAIQLPQPIPINSQTVLPFISLDQGIANSYSIFQFVSLSTNQNPLFLISDNEEYDLYSLNLMENANLNIYNNVSSYFEISAETGTSLYLNKLTNDENKEVWHYSSINKGLKTIDGDLSDWNVNEIVSSDDQGDIEPDCFDLTDLYAAYVSETDNLYLSFPVNLQGNLTSDVYLSFLIVIDDSWIGVQNNFGNIDYFPFPAYLGFENATINKIFEIDAYYVNNEFYKAVHFHKYYSSGDWENEYFIDGIVPFVITDSTIEMMIPSEYFDITDCKLAVISTAWSGIIEDVIPSSPLSPPTVLYGLNNAYSISDYVNVTDLVDAEQQIIFETPELILNQNHPNPFNPSTTISFNLTAKNAKNAKLEIYNLKGQKIRTFDCSNSIAANTSGSCSTYSVIWNGTDDNNRPVASGIYFYKVRAGNLEQSKKMILMK